MAAHDLKTQVAAEGEAAKPATVRSRGVAGRSHALDGITNA
jgi:hypothetical protein